MAGALRAWQAAGLKGTVRSLLRPPRRGGSVPLMGSETQFGSREQR